MPESEWDALVPDGPGALFAKWRFLASFEDPDALARGQPPRPNPEDPGAPGVLGTRRGWCPRFVWLRRGSRLVGAAPCYVKFHSMGEFVFDWSWAEYAERCGRPYYPKLLVGIPFTPVSGPRLLTLPGADRPVLLQALAEALRGIAEETPLSGVHANFLRDDELAALTAAGFLRRAGVQYHWRRAGASDFEAYLERFRSKQRNQVRRERRQVAARGIEITTLRAPFEAPPDVLGPLAHRLYRATIDQKVWGRAYLSEAVFRAWFQAMPDDVELVLARRGEDVLAGALNFGDPDTLYGRYWGALRPEPHLHFAVCYYHSIDDCLRRGRSVFEPGAGGEHKLRRGFDPTLRYSAHWLSDVGLRTAVARFLHEEGREIEAAVEAYRTGA